MADATLPCIKCGTVLENGHAGTSPDNIMPGGGTQFSSHGHYGSTAWDPMSDPSKLIINICDSCLVAAAHGGLVLKASPSIRPRTPDWEYTSWTP
jgi:hypothetical protein